MSSPFGYRKEEEGGIDHENEQQQRQRRRRLRRQQQQQDDYAAQNSQQHHYAQQAPSHQHGRKYDPFEARVLASPSDAVHVATEHMGTLSSTPRKVIRHPSSQNSNQDSSHCGVIHTRGNSDRPMVTIINRNEEGKFVWGDVEERDLVRPGEREASRGAGYFEQVICDDEHPPPVPPKDAPLRRIPRKPVGGYSQPSTPARGRPVTPKQVGMSTAQQQQQQRFGTPNSSSSRNGSTRPGFWTRTFSFGSNGSRPSSPAPRTPTSRSRRGSKSSITDSIRKGTQHIQHGLDLGSLTDAERRSYFAHRKAEYDRQIEHQRQADPRLRPTYQKEFMVEQKRGRFEYDEENKVWEDLYPNLWTDVDAKEMEPYNKTPVEMSSTERLSAIQFATTKKNGRCVYEALADRDAKPKLTNGEKAGLFLAQKLKLGGGLITRPQQRRQQQRRDSADSELDFADAAPAGHMEECGVCGEWRNWLTNGRCVVCHRTYLEGMDEPRSLWDATPNSSEDVEEDSLCDDSPPGGPKEVNEEGHMKLTINRKIRRIRQTEYEDPGNPFTFEGDSDTLPTNDYNGSSTGSPASSDPFSLGTKPDIPLADSPLSISRLLEARRFPSQRNSHLYAPTPRRSGTPDLVRKLSIPASSIWPVPPVQDAVLMILPRYVYVPPRQMWKKRDPCPPVQHHDIGLRGADGMSPSTQFYEFYSGILEEYSP